MTPPEYLSTHPFLDFKPDLRGAPFALWTLLGEAKSKWEHIAGAPLLPQIRATMHQVYLAKGARATTAIENNTLSEEEVMALVEGDLEVAPSREYLKQEVRNIINACNRLMLLDSNRPLTVEDILEFNRWVLASLPLKEDVAPGEMRQHGVTVGRYVPPHARYMRELLERFVEWLNDFTDEIAPGMNVQTAILKSILAHLYLVWIHPFGDGNGRTARLLEWNILLRSGVPTPVAHLLSNHYNQTRDRYYAELDKAGRSRDVCSFVMYALEGFVEGLAEQIKYVQGQQMGLIWISLVHEAFAGQKGDIALRRRELALELSGAKWVHPVEAENLTPKIARLYAAKSTRTAARDLNELVRIELAERRGNLYRARWDRVIEMLPSTLT